VWGESGIAGDVGRRYRCLIQRGAASNLTLVVLRAPFEIRIGMMFHLLCLGSLSENTYIHYQLVR
jgi:hypothetical protein